MAYRRTGRISVRRTCRAYTRRRPVYRKPNYRFRRSRFRNTRRRLANTQNWVKFHCKQYDTDIMQPKATTTTTTGDLQTKQIDVIFSRFWIGNQVFCDNLDRYQYIKFNYLAIHIKELNWIGYSRTNTDTEGLKTSGVTALNFNNLPVYCYWDTEADMQFTGANAVTDQQFAQYPGTKKLYPGRKAVKFVWRFPQPWRQYFSTYYFRNKDVVPTLATNIGDVMGQLTGTTHLRYPKYILMSHPNFWGSAFPVNPATNTAEFAAQYAIEWHMGVTFKGRRLMGATSTACISSTAEKE